MLDLLLAIKNEDWGTPVPRCGQHLRDAKAWGWVANGPTGMPQLTTHGRAALAEALR